MANKAIKSLRKCTKTNKTINKKMKSERNTLPLESLRRRGRNLAQNLSTKKASKCCDIARYLTSVHRQCLAVVRQLMSHDWGGPFRMPVDAEALGLVNYHTIITNPMDLGTIKKFIEDGGRYELAKEVHEDIELTFNNAMKFNAEGTDVHVMAKTLLALWHTKYEGIVAREKEVEEGLLLDRDARIAKVAAAASKLEYQTIQSECLTIMQALGLAQNQLSDLESKSIILFKPMTADEKSVLGDILKSLTVEDAEKARQILSDAPTKEYDHQILAAESQHRQRVNAGGNHSDERQMRADDIDGYHQSTIAKIHENGCPKQSRAERRLVREPSSRDEERARD